MFQKNVMCCEFYHNFEILVHLSEKKHQKDNCPRIYPIENGFVLGELIP